MPTPMVERAPEHRTPPTNPAVSESGAAAGAAGKKVDDPLVYGTIDRVAAPSGSVSEDLSAALAALFGVSHETALAALREGTAAWVRARCSTGTEGVTQTTRLLSAVNCDVRRSDAC